MENARKTYNQIPRVSYIFQIKFHLIFKRYKGFEFRENNTNIGRELQEVKDILVVLLI